MLRSLIALALLLIGAEGIRLWWFSDSQAEDLTPAGLSMNSIPRFEPERVASESNSAILHRRDIRQEKVVDGLLGHDRSRCGVWQDEHSPNLRVHYTWVEYDAGNTRYLKDLFGHPPEVCVGKSGATQIAIHPNRQLQIDGREHEVRHVEFADPVSGVPFQIFKFAWLPEVSPLQFNDGNSGQDLRSARLKAAWSGLPRSDARMMIAVVFGAEGAQQGWQQFNRTFAASLTSGAAGEDQPQPMVENRVGD